MFAALPYKFKIALLTLIPLIIAISGIALATAHQTKLLASTQAETFEQELLNTKKNELKNYMELAYTAIINVYENPNVAKKHAQQEVYDILKNMEYGEDGYFFVYDYNGVNIVHSRKPELEGKNLFNFKDDNGKLLIQELIQNAKQGGGFTHYLWDKPSGGKSVEKLSYSIGLDKWQWMVGTGLYIDDIEKGVFGIKDKANNTNKKTLLLTSIIAIIATLLTSLIGFLINLSEGKLATQKMRDLTNKTVNFQEDERKRVSRELHDGINQLLVSVRYKLDTAKSKLLKPNSETENTANIIDEADEILNTGIQEVRRISRDLRPSLLDDLGLDSAIKSLLSDFSERTNIIVDYKNNATNTRLPQEIETAFYRIIQEAVTNIEKHALSAKHVTLKIDKKRASIHLSISNDGIGFDKQTLEQTNPERGLGLRNMVDRTELLEGFLTVNSSIDKGTTVIVHIPL
ncbi:cache domain-containing protein [Cocleimonas flava]|uniref:histidine kinase n=1 Tax=Cocleimonas flava TaxID=634765 RepID=A0A4R1F8P1_9GAMM|nr:MULTISPECIES: cache domain-containing protein [Cocleimonas]MEB8434102.1 cache domain-containing protein [Cocleimonas sp. KMM 6892]MEC4717038.1 cache domain-containing protein [Cocleimonas sp. KMM 6895]MEC4746374.1 cache domain-containing protein [Cocleimonas sp. KMM 6896]TCJ88208.1 two-component system NarL family sensor kinase [Cocleimonas flava]